MSARVDDKHGLVYCPACLRFHAAASSEVRVYDLPVALAPSSILQWQQLQKAALHPDVSVGAAIFVDPYGAACQSIRLSCALVRLTIQTIPCMKVIS